MSLSRGAGLGSIGLSNSSPNLGGSGTEDGSDPTTRFAPGANSAWDFINNYARFKDVYYGPLANTPGWSFTRASTGYAQNAAGVLVPFASGELRRTDKGVLIEGARTNLCLQSQTLGTTWGPNNTSVQSDTASAPDGTTTADTLTENSASAEHSLTQSVTVSNATAYTVSVYAKYKSRQWIRVGASFGANSYAYFDIQNGVVGTVLGGWTSTISALSGGWYRCSITFTSNTTTGSVILNLASADGTTSYLGDGTSGLYLWGAQLEAASFPSSLVTTTTASATRAADVLTVPVSALTYPLSLFAEFERAVLTASVGGIIETYAAGGNRFVLTLSGAAETIQQYNNSGNVDQVNNTIAGAIGVGAVTKVAARTSTNDTMLVKNGTLGTKDSSCTNPAAPTAVWLGSQIAGGGPSFSYLRKAALWNRALSDSELQTVTT